ncbi:MAG: DUF1828 domain-containing protein [Bryobacteraceae bacterium]
MSAAEIEKLLNDYRAWLKDKTTLRELNGDWIEITTPYLDRHNDALQIYARGENTGYLLSDDSYTIHDLEVHWGAGKSLPFDPERGGHAMDSASGRAALGRGERSLSAAPMRPR